MKLPEEAVRLSVYLGENARKGSKPLSEVIVEEARRLGLAGATVLRGVSGFGANSRIKTSKILLLSQDLPLVVEIIDTRERIDSLLPFIDAHLGEGLVTLEPVQVLHYRHTAEN